MIRLGPECYPCFLRQADLAARAHGASDEARCRLAARVAGMLTSLDAAAVPADLASGVQEVIREELGTDDPFRAVKRRELSRFRQAAARAETFVRRSTDPLASAVAMSAYANIMDSGIIEEGDKEREIAGIESLCAGFALPEGLRMRIRDAGSVVVLLDNAGEAAYDAPLLSLLCGLGKSLRIVAKGGPVIDDLTFEEAREIGIDRYGELFSNGNRSIGTDLSRCPPGFAEQLLASDLVLAKGQANFETLWGRLRNAWFLLRCKCPVISRAVGKPEGEVLLLDGARA